MFRATFLLLLLCAAVLPVHAGSELVMVATDGASMPLADIVAGEVVGGIMHDVGDAIALGLGRKVRYLAVPRNRMLTMLSNGEADGFCYARPQWYGQEGLNWTKPLIPSGNVVITRSDVPRPANFAELKGRRIGTVLGYKYPELDELLNLDYVRDDARNTDLNFRKIAAGRVDHAVVDSLNLAWYLRLQNPPLRLHPKPLVATSFVAQCAFSKASQIPFADIERSVNRLLDGKKMDAILDKYR